MRERLIDSIDQLLPILTETKSYKTRRTTGTVRKALAMAERALQVKPVAGLAREAQEAYTDLKAGFESSLSGLLGDFEGGTITKGQFLGRLKGSIKDNYEAAYRIGLRFGGSKITIDPEDLKWLATARRDEFGFLNRFVEAIEQGTSKIKPADRMKMYVNTLDSIFHVGTVEAQDDLAEVIWALGVAEHCPDCLNLAANSPYTKATLPTTPRAGDTQCLSNCKCRLIFRQQAVDTPEEKAPRPRGGAPAPDRPPPGFRRPSGGERAFIENLMAQMAFSRALIPQLRGEARQAEILARKSLGDDLLGFLEDRKIFVRPTWAAGNRPFGQAINRDALEEVLRGVDLTTADIKELRRVSAGEFDDLIDRFEAQIAAKEALGRVSAGAKAKAAEMTRATKAAMVVGLAAVVAADGEPEEPGDEEEDELEEEVVTTADIAPFPRKDLPRVKDKKKARFSVGQKFKFKGSPFTFRITGVSVETKTKKIFYALEDEENPERKRTATEADLRAAKVVK